jgi:hypothetical protein
LSELALRREDRALGRMAGVQIEPNGGCYGSRRLRGVSNDSGRSALVGPSYIIALLGVRAPVAARAEAKEDWITLGARIHGAFALHPCWHSHSRLRRARICRGSQSNHSRPDCLIFPHRNQARDRNDRPVPDLFRHNLYFKEIGRGNTGRL